MGLLNDARQRIDNAQAAIEAKRSERTAAAADVARYAAQAQRGDLDAAARLQPSRDVLERIDNELLHTATLYREWEAATAALAGLQRQQADLQQRVDKAAVRAAALGDIDADAVHDAAMILLAYLQQYPAPGRLGGPELLRYLSRVGNKARGDLSELARLRATLARY